MAKINPIELQKYLKGVDYPASKQDLIQTAEKHGATDNIRSALEQLPDEQFEKPTDVNAAIGDMN
ncbi:DUF2795 domain-containing protein [Egbenema bharatensis]|uniref:DUF2795 domain-containing protein n=1 Tax=Egbenema bharatensis TaxID=3463334 RepID=UPI003A8464A0